MKFGVRLPNSGPFANVEALTRVAEESTKLNYDALWVHDHLSWHKEDATHFAAGSWEAVEHGTYQPFFEAITTLAYFSYLDDIRFGTAAIVLPFRNPIAVARQFGTLDELTGGRMILGVCPGGVPHEFERLGIPHKNRGSVTEEYMEVINLLFSDEPVASYDGKYFKFSDVEFFPKPKNIPMWYGAHPSARTAKRVVKYTDGWMPAYVPAPVFKETIKMIREYAPKFDRDPDEFEFLHETYICIAETTNEAEKISAESMKNLFTQEKHEKSFLIGSPKDIIKKLQTYDNAGVTDFEIKFMSRSVDQMLGMMNLFAEEVKPEFPE
jgi:alkanesulfonate monooxygenase SsuD/methylene tetrahydromethanopterin reductase-like flavin-dependent oxidoreductase (luciferase family)